MPLLLAVLKAALSPAGLIVGGLIASHAWAYHRGELHERAAVAEDVAAANARIEQSRAAWTAAALIAARKRDDAVAAARKALAELPPPATCPAARPLPADMLRKLNRIGG